MLEAIAAFPLADLLRRSVFAYAAVSAAHILAIALLAGALAVLDLRLLGAFARLPQAALADALEKVAGAGLLLAAATGALLFSVRPDAYAANPVFLVKLALIAAASANALVLRASPGWHLLRAGHPASMGVKAGAVLSLFLWVCVLGAGRWIGFVQ